VFAVENNLNIHDFREAMFSGFSEAIGSVDSIECMLFIPIISSLVSLAEPYAGQKSPDDFLSRQHDGTLPK
jgi:hypothetical protein